MVTKEELAQIVSSAVSAAQKAPNMEGKAVDHACSCPGCYCGIIERMNKTSDYACKRCGLPLGNEAFARKILKCPNCGRTAAMKVTDLNE